MRRDGLPGSLRAAVRSSPARKAFVVLNSLLLASMAATMVVPLLNVLAVSFATDLESYETGIKLWPREPSTEGYAALFERVAIFGPLANNAFVTVVGTALHVAICAMAGFVLVKEKFPGKAALVLLVTLPMMIPFELILIPVYVTVKRLGLMDSLWAIILTGAASTFAILLMRNYFESIPRSLEESALMDGAGELTVFFRVYLPLARPGLATVTIFQFVAKWNHILPAVLFINSADKYTLQVALKSLVVSQELTSTTQSVANNARMAGIVVAIIPLILVYLLAQRTFVKGIMVGAVKE
jgi:putative aldouronate transport system permease protein